MVRAVREERRLFLVAFGGACLAGLLTIGSAFVLGAIVARVVVPALERRAVDAGAVTAAAAVLLAVSLLKVVGMVGRRLGSGYMYLRLTATYRRLVARRYLDLPPAWHHRHATGRLLSTAGSDVDAAWQPTSTLAFALATIVMFGAALVSLLVTDWVLALVGVALFPTLFAIYSKYSNEVAARYARVQQLRGEVSGIAHESFDGALVVKVMGREADETARFAAKVAELRDTLIGIGRIRGFYDPLVDSLPSVGTLAVLMVGSWRLSQGAIGVRDLVGAAFLFALLDFPVRAIGWVLTGLPFAVAGWERVEPVLTERSELAYGDRAPAGAGTAPAELTFTDVTFGYGAEPVLRSVTFTVPRGRVLALVGPTGSGKSTIATLAARLLDPASGEVRLDGVDARQLRADALAGTVGYVPQVPFVFDDTVRGNVSLDRGIDDGQVWEALRLAQADGFVARLPDGLDTLLGERGILLSGGQRQRLTVARALAGRPRLLVLDDATSGVDPKVEAAILASLSGVEQTILVIAARRATIALADEVVYVADGRAVATGTHAELLASVPGYADLVTAYERADAEKARAHAYDEDASAIGATA